MATAILISHSKFGYAQSSSEIAAAQASFKQGLALERTSKWSEALVQFRRAAVVKRTPQIVFHVGLCEKQIGMLVEASVDLDRSLDMANAENNDQVARAVKDELESLRPRVPKLRILISKRDPVVRLEIDGNKMAVGAIEQPIPLNPGSHRVAVDFAHGEFSSTTSLSEGETVELRAVPTRMSAPEAAKADDPRSRSSIGGFSVAGFGLASLGVGAIFFGLRAAAIRELDGVCGTDRQHCPATEQDTVAAGKRDSAIAVTLTGVGAAALLTGIALVLFRGHETSSAPSSLRLVNPFVYPGGVGFTGQF